MKASTLKLQPILGLPVSDNLQSVHEDRDYSDHGHSDLGSMNKWRP